MSFPEKESHLFSNDKNHVTLKPRGSLEVCITYWFHYIFTTKFLRSNLLLLLFFSSSHNNCANISISSELKPKNIMKLYLFNFDNIFNVLFIKLFTPDYKIPIHYHHCWASLIFGIKLVPHWRVSTKISVPQKHGDVIISYHSIQNSYLSEKIGLTSIDSLNKWITVDMNQANSIVKK